MASHLDHPDYRALEDRLAGDPGNPLHRRVMSDWLRDQGDNVGADYHAHVAGRLAAETLGLHGIGRPVLMVPAHEWDLRTQRPPRAPGVAQGVANPDDPRVGHVGLS